MPRPQHRVRPTKPGLHVERCCVAGDLPQHHATPQRPRPPRRQTQLTNEIRSRAVPDTRPARRRRTALPASTIANNINGAAQCKPTARGFGHPADAFATTVPTVNTYRHQPWQRQSSTGSQIGHRLIRTRRTINSQPQPQPQHPSPHTEVPPGEWTPS
jgi:hypothetical protein